ncbi:hypothetical protein DSCO28_45820 [Desulfosarcina ovata subsp. sediminis]|uniref:Uncharacterized protein n=1 Tax=Desulfosarcina ovata subsp. sediminis TaxID=885957 RepID=A0A5K7ZV41_9BACT|nr:hypothetical protein [Desulfosarcina ovata]BBO84016.1 hypothetical protein DSCO28_45820 [Desulfosarcina ovata subsp. sediminis]
MYRLCKLFISDVTAGENLLRNAFVPIARENGDADHGVLFAANGTCKTTLLSFILSVFSPDQRRFVQHLQSTGDKTLEQYLIPGRPAVVLVDIASIGQATLFESAPENHLVLGQLLYRPRGAADKVDRIFFIAHSPVFFDRLRTAWDTLLVQEQPWRTVRDFTTPHVQQTTLQNEWATVLERLGLDPWLIDRQIDFARSEGGIKDAFKFRSETEFLNFFLGCVTDMEAAVTLRETIGRSLRKMEDRPRKIAQLAAARELKERIRDFDAMACLWRDAQVAIDAAQAVLGEAAHLMQQTNEAAGRKLKILVPAMKEAESQRRDANAKREVARANVSAVERFQIRQAIAHTEQAVEAAEKEIQAFKGEENALKAADLMADIRRNRAQEEIKRDALRQADEELSPLLQRIDTLGLQYHARLDEDRRGQLDLIAEREGRIAEWEASITAGEAHRAAQAAERSALEEKMLGNTTRIRAAEERRDALPMQPGERPEDARERLSDALRDVETRITAARGRRAALEEEMRAGDSRWRILQKNQSEAAVQREQAKARLDDEARQREQLLASSHLQRVAGSATFDPTAADLVSRLDDAIARGRKRLDKKQRQRLDLGMELERLTGTETLTADAQTRRLIAHYHEEGISPGELKAFPEYLAGLYAAPEEIARFIESDPGRFTGIMAATEAVVEAVVALPVPDWLHRPVVVSTPVAPDDLTPISATVVCPNDPGVYSKRYLEETRTHLQDRSDAMGKEIDTQTGDLREMEADSRDLHAYREKFPDAATVTALTDRLQALDRRLAELATEIADEETLAETVRQRKADQDATLQTLTADEVRLGERRSQVEDWLQRYASLETWKREAEEMIAAKEALAARLEVEEKFLRQMREEIAVFKADIRESHSLIKGLDERAADVPKPQESTLSDGDRKTALTMDRTTLKTLFEEARERQRRKADELGISTLQRELDELQTLIGQQEARLDSLCREHAMDASLAVGWAARSAADREERRAVVAEAIQAKSGTIGGLRSDITHQKQNLDRLNTALSEIARKGIQPDILEADLVDQDLDGMIHRFQREADRHAETLERLNLRCRELEALLKAHEEWQREAELGLAETQTFAPVWDRFSPRVDWPETVGTSSVEECIAAVRALKTQARERMTAFEEQRQAMETARRRMGTGFERLRADLAGERFRSHLPAVIDELMRHDTESLGAQAEELIQRCEEMAQNIESDLSISQQIMHNLVDMLLSRAKEYHQKLQTAAQQILPEDVYIYGGRSILLAGTRLDFTRHGEDFKRSVENWLHELIQQDRLPEVNQRAGNCLGSELLYQLLGASTGKKAFGIRLLKCDDTGRNYEPVGKDLGSGGEALTTAVLLYTLLIFMRKKRHSHPDGRIPAFLVLDNPLGVCNRSDFLDAQLKVARAMGIQCVYLTGINDRESLGLFELRVAIRKGEKKVEIGKMTYDLLEIAELHVEKTNGPVLA